ncbi:hypothetical protein CSB45_02865 [candidate division KSB3 bacterium]|uniref:EF-hand domain-containing protein n=1 Tax=candidate division KSB3 bacterium TaxID=2044937 RepID=A0A2G6E9G1_9BACT|nr:MAG: hypothetical protein CSB45_02865 [candidate division KSB3 bacterium]
MASLSLLFSSTGWAEKIVWHDYKYPLKETIRVFQHEEYAIESVDVQVSLPSQFLRHHKEIELLVYLRSRTVTSKGKTGFHDFSPLIRVNNAFIKRYKIPVKKTPSRQHQVVRIARKDLKPGGNTLQFTFKWHHSGWSCSGKGCGYEITKMVFKDAPKPTPTPTPTRTPTPRPRKKTTVLRPTATPTPSPVISLLEQADRYVEKKWFLTPKETNAFDTYKRVLRISPSNMHARKKLYEMMKGYKSWGDNNYKEGAHEKAKSYYERYMTIARYVKDELRSQFSGQIEQDFTMVSDRLELIENPPTPTPSPEPLSDDLPVIEISTELPEKCESEELTLQGSVKDDLGVTGIYFFLNSEAHEELTFPEDESLVEQPFETTFSLSPGDNTISIEARDTSGQRMTWDTRLTRQLPPETPPVAPTPQLPLLDEYPDIIFLPELPSETQEPYIHVEGHVKDDRGIQDFKISIRRPDSTWFEVLRNVTFDGTNFSADIRLEIGETTLMLVAADTLGQLTKKEVMIQRRSETKAPDQDDGNSASEFGEHAPENTAPAVKRVVILVAAEEYLDAAIPPYQCAENDVHKVYEFFTDPERGGLPQEQVILLTGTDVTERTLKKTFGEWLRQQAKAGDISLLVYFIGYGGCEHDRRYWLSHDTTLDDIFSTSLDLRKINTLLSRIPTQFVTIFLDTVFLGGEQSGAAEPLWKILSGEGRAIAAASHGKTPHICDDEQSGSSFTSSFLQGLAGEADLNSDGKIYSPELWEFMSRSLTNAADGAERLHPVLVGELPHELLVTLPLPEEKLSASGEKKRPDAKDAIIDIYRNGHISADQFKRALQILKNGETDRLLEDYLDGKIPLDIFKDTF